MSQAVKGMGPGVPQGWDRNLAPSQFTSCVTVGMLLNSSEPQYPHPQNGHNSSTFPLPSLWLTGC